MAGTVLHIDDYIKPDKKGMEIARYWHLWNSLKATWTAEQEEIRKYIYAVDTTTTTNSKLPWKNKTTIPKLCQLADNLEVNYYASMFPAGKKKWLTWDAYDRESAARSKDITGVMCYVVEQPSWKSEIRKCLKDYIHHGNAFAMADWRDERVEVKLNGTTALTQIGYVGPGIRRISPHDIVFNPVAPSFEETPKIVRSLVSLGEVKKFLDSLSTDDNREMYQELFTYLMSYRNEAKNFAGDIQTKDEYLRVDGFNNYRAYLESNYCELLTFYGDIYDVEKNQLQENYIITVVDRHKIIAERPNPSYLGKAAIRHIGWRQRQDNLWAMGPLNNLVGMQYRVDHIENLKADCFDLIAFPPLKIKGYVEDFEWGPFARIHVGDEGDVEPLAPNWNVLTANIEIQSILALMEEMAGSPREAMGFRTPGEKTKYEVQRNENAGGRMFQSRTVQFEEGFIEPLLNDNLELYRRKGTENILARYFDDTAKITRFLSLSPEDISGVGRIRPYAARHFAEQAEIVQNLTAFFQSPIGMDPGVRAHFSTIKLASLFEHLLNIEEFDTYLPYVRMTEESEAQGIANVLKEKVMSEIMAEAEVSPEQVEQASMEMEAQEPFTSGVRGFDANNPETLPSPTGMPQ